MWNKYFHRVHRVRRHIATVRIAAVGSMTVAAVVATGSVATADTPTPQVQLSPTATSRNACVPVASYRVCGPILGEYRHMSGPDGPLGQPTSNEVELSDEVGRTSTFEHGTIVWSPDAGAHTVSGRIGEEWNKYGAQDGPLHYPVTDEIVNPHTRHSRQVFQGGTYLFSPESGERSSGVMAEPTDSTVPEADPMSIWESFPSR